MWWLGPTGVLTVAAIVFGVATMGLGKTGYAARIRDEHQRQETARKEAQRKRAAAAEAAQTAQAAQAATAVARARSPLVPSPRRDREGSPSGSVMSIRSSRSADCSASPSCSPSA